MAGPAPAEQAKQVEEPGIRAFSLVRPQEIARRIGRTLEPLLGRKRFTIRFLDTDARISWRGSGHAVLERSHLYNSEQEKYQLDNTAVIFGEGSVTFVYPIYEPVSVTPRVKVFSWVTISRREGIASYARAIRLDEIERASDQIDPQIIEAARHARNTFDRKNV